VPLLPTSDTQGDYTQGVSSSSNSNSSGMWIEMAMALFGMGQENTIRNQQVRIQENQALANVLFRDRQSNEQLFVILGIMFMIAIVFFVVLKK